MDDLVIENQPERGRYAALLDGEARAFAYYDELGDAVVFTHTETADGFGGQGIAGALVRRALDDARARNLRVVPRCPFVKHWIDEHGEYADLLRPRPAGVADGASGASDGTDTPVAGPDRLVVREERELLPDGRHITYYSRELP